MGVVLRIAIASDAVERLRDTGVIVAASCAEAQASTPPSRHKRSRMPLSQRGAPRQAVRRPRERSKSRVG